MALLEAKQVTKRFGSLVAINRVDVNIESGSIHAFPNQHGKFVLVGEGKNPPLKLR